MRFERLMLRAGLAMLLAAPGFAQKEAREESHKAPMEKIGTAEKPEAKEEARKAYIAFFVGNYVAFKMPETFRDVLRTRDEGAPEKVVKVNEVEMTVPYGVIKTPDYVATYMDKSGTTKEFYVGDDEGHLRSFIIKTFGIKPNKLYKGHNFRDIVLLKPDGVWKKGEPLLLETLYGPLDRWKFPVVAARKTPKDLEKAGENGKTAAKKAKKAED